MESATIGCAIALCGLVSPWCKLASSILAMFHVDNYVNDKDAEGRTEGTREDGKHTSNS